jgi:uncharacterized membrane protein YdcZ (DUF606 family)
MNVIAEGTTPQELESAMSQFKAGQTGEIRFYLDKSLTPDEITGLYNKLLASGFILTEPLKQEGTILSVEFQKTSSLQGIGSFWTDLWSYIKAPFQVLSTMLKVPWWVWVGGGVAIMYLFFSSDTGKKVTKEAGGLALTAGKVYITKGALKNPMRSHHLAVYATRRDARVAVTNFRKAYPNYRYGIRHDSGSSYRVWWEEKVNHGYR